MVIWLKVPGIRYEVESLCRMLFPEETVTLTEEEKFSPAAGENLVLLELLDSSENKADCRLTVRMAGQEREALFSAPADTHSLEQSFCTRIYDVVTEISGKPLPWGMLTGVRPVKLIRQMLEEGKTREEVRERFLGYYRVSEERTRLAFETWDRQSDLFLGRDSREVSLYLSIPFCPSRCSYCSFVSHSIEKTAKLVPEYVECLIREMKETARLLKESGLKIITVYMGGGTPTTLTALQMDAVLSTLRAEFDLSACREITVEAGRPDTITREKFRVMAKNGVTRVSINPQTLNDEVLKEIGRRHSVEEFFEAYQLAREFPFEVNVDLIAGLPKDDYASFCRSLDGIIALKPEDITVHTLTIKHASALREEEPRERTAFHMVEYSQKALALSGYSPYYLYRQKGTVDSLENVGYSLEGSRCLYNVYIMDDSHTIISMGAGGVTKLVPAHNGKIERYFNYKYPYEYISRFDSVLERKRELPLAKIL